MAFNAPKINPLNVSGIASGLRTSMDRLRSDNQRAWDQTMKGFEMAGQAGKDYRDYQNNELNNEAVKAYLKLIQEDEDDDKAIQDLQQRIAALKGVRTGSGSPSLSLTSTYNVMGNPSQQYDFNSDNLKTAVVKQLLGIKAGL